MKKFFLVFLFFLSFSFINVNAEVLSHQDHDMSNLIANNQSGIINNYYTFNTRPFNGRGPGFLTFSFNIVNVPLSNVTNMVNAYSVQAVTNTGYFACNLGSVPVNNTTRESAVYSVSCPVDFSNSPLTALRFYVYYGGGSGSTSDYIAIVNFNGLVTYNSTPVFDTSNISSSIASSQQATVNAITGTTNAVNNNTNAVNNNTNAVNNVKNSVDQTNNNIMNDDVTDSTNTASGFFDNFSQNSHGLSGIVTAPLRLIRALVSAQCRPLTFELPFVEKNVSLQCMRPIYEDYFGVFFTLFQLITTGMISYHILINIYKKVRDLQNPKNDRIEVLNL